MQDRATLGDQFTQEVNDQLKEWGVSTVKMIEFMDIRDSAGSQVIANMMAKEKSRIEKESRVTVAANIREAEMKEIEAQREIALTRTQAEQQVGIREAEKDKEVGIAKERSNQEVQAEAKVTTERLMEVKKVEDVKSAEIARDVAVVKAEQDKQVQVVKADAEKESTVRIADGNLAATLKAAEGIQAEGNAKAEAEKAMLLAPVNAQLTLAKEIGDNQGYQTYLISVRNIEATEAVGKEMAGAIKAADVKIIANSGDVQSGIGNLADIFTPKGGTSIGGMLEGLAQTEQGQALLGGVLSKLNTTDTEAKVAPKKSRAKSNGAVANETSVQ
jgi:flotillin